MTFVPVEKLPAKGRRNVNGQCEWKPLKSYLDEFMKMNVKYAKVEFENGEYSNWRAAYESLRHSIERAVLPIDVKMRVYGVYLIRRDLEDPNERL